MLDTIAGPAGHLHIDDDGVVATVAPPVVFVHSFAGDSLHWAGALAHLRPARRAIAIDLRGHGQSDPPASGGWDVDDFADDIAAVVDRLALPRFVLVGHSLGGSAAVAYAGAQPSRVAGLVLIGTPGRSDPGTARTVVAALEADYEHVMNQYWDKLLTDARPEVAQTIRSRSRTIPRDVSLAIIRAIFAYDPLAALRAYPGPVLLVDTGRDQGPGPFTSRCR
jgi:pimeloyl-ACP methyl ester carboxylesterase